MPAKPHSIAHSVLIFLLVLNVFALSSAVSFHHHDGEDECGEPCAFCSIVLDSSLDPFPLPRPGACVVCSVPDIRVRGNFRSDEHLRPYPNGPPRSLC